MPHKKEELLKAATYIFAQKGYRGASTRAIARRAQVNEGSIYRLFGSKRRLYWAVLEESLDAACSFLASQKENSPEEILMAWTQASKTDLVAMRLLHFAILEGAPEGRKVAKRSLAQLYLPLADYVEGLKQRGTIGSKIPTWAAALTLACLAGYPMFFEAGGDYLFAADPALPRYYAQIWLHGVEEKATEAEAANLTGGHGL